MTFRTEHLAERIRAKIVVDASGCWLWTASKDRKGYGQYRLNGKNRKAHVVVYRELVGSVPAGLQLDHLCRVRHCVNPAHLEPVTCAENIRRGESGNRKKTHCPKGHEYTPDNTYVHNNKRQCKTCAASRPRVVTPERRAERLEYMRAWRQKQQAAP